MKNKKITAIIYALAAALFYAINVPCSKLLLESVAPTFMAAFLYLGAGLGVGTMYLFRWKNEKKEGSPDKNDLPYTIGMVVLGATACWGLENNCTRNISGKSTYQIVAIKGFFSGAGSFVIALILGERLPGLRFVLSAMMLGFVAYRLSIFTYIRAQKTFGAAKTSAYYAVAPFIGASHMHTITHSHMHSHCISESKHRHRHNLETLENSL